MWVILASRPTARPPQRRRSRAALRIAKMIAMEEVANRGEAYPTTMCMSVFRAPPSHCRYRDSQVLTLSRLPLDTTSNVRHSPDNPTSHGLFE